jgi:hypothetical protein
MQEVSLSPKGRLLLSNICTSSEAHPSSYVIANGAFSQRDLHSIFRYSNANESLAHAKYVQIMHDDKHDTYAKSTDDSRWKSSKNMT